MKKPFFFLLLPALLLFPPRAAALDGPGLTNGVWAVWRVLGFEGHQREAMRGLVDRNGWTPDDCTEILLSLEESIRPLRTDHWNSFLHEVTFSLMSEFATTNALPALAELFWDETMPGPFGPGRAYVRIGRCAPEFREPLIRRIDTPADDKDLFAYRAYEEVRSCLQRRDYTPRNRQDLVDFLVRRAGEDVRNAGHVDEILCEQVPAWKGSPQRLANAERMLRLHPDAASRSVFAGVTNSLRNLSPAVRAKPPSLVPAPLPPPLTPAERKRFAVEF